MARKSFERHVYQALAVANDLNAVKRGKVPRRIGRRIYGRVSGRLARRIFG
jgi:hypothetical protein